MARAAAAADSRPNGTGIFARMEFMRCTLFVASKNQSLVAKAARAAGLNIDFAANQTSRFVAPAGRVLLFRRILSPSVRTRRQFWTEEAVALIENSICSLTEKPDSPATRKLIVQSLAPFVAEGLNIRPAVAREFIQDAVCGLLALGLLVRRNGRILSILR